MSVPKTMSGARAKFGIFDPQTGESRILGTVSSVTYGLTYEAQPAYVLGRFTAGTIQHTSVDIVHITASGWRNFGLGAHKEMSLPQVQDLLLYQPIELFVVDRATEAQGGEPRVAKIRNVLPVSFSGGFSAKSLSEMGTNYVGILVDDESVTNAEHPTAVQFPG